MSFNLHDRTIFLVLAGSHAYGFATPESDHDYRGIVIPPLDSYIGLQSKFEQCVDTDKSKAASQHFPAGVLEADADVQVMELTKLVRLACQNNPSILEILFTDEQHWIIKKDVMNKLLEHRDKLLSKACKARFCGYALSQLKRIKRHKKWLDNPPDHQPTREEFGLPDRSLLSQDQMGAAEALIQKEIDEFMVDQTHLPEDVKIELDQGMGRMMRAVWQTIYPGLDYPVGDGKPFESTDEALFWGAARDQEFSDNFLEALNREKKYRAAKREWDSYQRWLVQRNSKRAEIEKKLGYDCYSDDTEFLTEVGWKKFDEILPTDRLATVYVGEKMVEHAPFGIEYQEYTDKFDAEYDGTMYHLYGNHIDVLVTPNHRMLHRKIERKSGKAYSWCLDEVATMPDTFEVLRTITPRTKTYCNDEFGDLPIKDTQYLSLMGWYLSDGTMLFRHNKGGSKAKSIRISQKKGGKLSWFMSRWNSGCGKVANASLYDYEKKPSSFNPHGLTERILDVRNKKVVNRILSDCGSTTQKRIPRWVFRLSKRLMNVLLDSLIRGDGTKSRPDDSIIYYSTLKGLADDVQELAFLCGYETSLYGPYNYGKDIHGYDTTKWQVHVNKTRAQFKRCIRANNIERVSRKRRIVCFTVPNRTLVTRRNGHVGIHGNSKHATHLVRLIKMAREILEKKQVNVLRPDAEELLAIRNGAWSYEQIVEFAEREDEALNEVAKKCDLPKVAPIDFFHDIVQDMILEFNQTEMVTPAVAYGAPMPIYGAVLAPGTFRQRYYQLVVTHMNPLKKVPVIKFFRELTGWGLYEAKLAFEHGRWADDPTRDIEDARKLKAKFDELGCKSVIEMFDMDDIGTVYKLGFYKEG